MICLDAYLEAEQKMDKICSSNRLTYTFAGDQYPMQLVVNDDKDTAQTVMPGMPEEVNKLGIIYKFDGSGISWEVCSGAEITNDLNNKLVSAFKKMCNAYAHFRFCELLGGDT